MVLNWAIFSLDEVISSFLYVVIDFLCKIFASIIMMDVMLLCILLQEHMSMNFQGKNVANFINAFSNWDIIFTRNATKSITFLLTLRVLWNLEKVMRLSLTNLATCSILLMFKSNYVLKEITYLNELVMKGEWILVVDNIECGQASQ